MSIDYRLLHHFRVSQRREMAARGELPTRFRAEGVEPAARAVTPALPPDPPEPRPHEPRPAPEPVPVLTQLLNEDR